jgi:tetratricopeptide (TPR) repeat protein
MSNFRYKAFISYSHADEVWARWLHRAIEAYRLPRNLVGLKTSVGEVPARIKPVFRDRDELSSASVLGDTVKQALSDSENLIVVCSPSSAASFWVKEEIREFIRLGRQDMIFCIIVDGEADASGSIAAVFPDAIAEAGMQEPLAADVRKWADGKQLAKLKLISGMLGAPLDQLRRRELQKRRTTLALTLAAVLSVVAVIIIAITSRMAAEQRRDSGEVLVGYKLNELRSMLSQAGEPENLDRLREWSQEEMAALITNAGSQTPELLSTAHQLRDEGIELLESGDTLGSIERVREGTKPERRLQYMQSALEYNQIALVLDPGSENYRSEVRESLANLADAQRVVCDLDGALQSRREGLALETDLFENDSDNPKKQENLARALTGYARVQAMRGFNDEAREYLQKSLPLIKAAARPDQITRTNRLLTERQDMIIWLDAMSGRIDEAWAGSEDQANDWQSLLETGLDNITTLLGFSAYLLDRAWLPHERATHH